MGSLLGLDLRTALAVAAAAVLARLVALLVAAGLGLLARMGMEHIHQSRRRAGPRRFKLPPRVTYSPGFCALQHQLCDARLLLNFSALYQHIVRARCQME
jgi:hypothetical protein